MAPIFPLSAPIITDASFPRMSIADWGMRFLQSKHARPYRHKSRKALTNFRSGNKKKLRQFVK